MKYIDSYAEGFVYCVARKGVTGEETDFSSTLDKYLTLCRQNTSLPLAVGFGVKDESDIEFLVGKSDIAVIGSETIRLIDEIGVEAVGEFIKGLR
jgi:tryptophan synthase alpha chain